LEYPAAWARLEGLLQLCANFLVPGAIARHSRHLLAPVRKNCRHATFIAAGVRAFAEAAVVSLLAKRLGAVFAPPQAEFCRV